MRVECNATVNSTHFGFGQLALTVFQYIVTVLMYRLQGPTNYTVRNQ